jgi:hypothetical protein
VADPDRERMREPMLEEVHARIAIKTARSAATAYRIRCIESKDVPNGKASGARGLLELEEW